MHFSLSSIKYCKFNKQRLNSVLVFDTFEYDQGILESKKESFTTKSFLVSAAGN